MAEIEKEYDVVVLGTGMLLDPSVWQPRIVGRESRIASSLANSIASCGSQA